MSDAANANTNPLLDSPVKNIRIKVNVTSNEIVGVSGDPVPMPMADNSSESKMSSRQRQSEEGDDSSNNVAEEPKTKKMSTRSKKKKGNLMLDYNDYILDDDDASADDDVEEDDDSKDPSYKGGKDDDYNPEDDDIMSGVEEEEEDEEFNRKASGRSPPTRGKASSSSARATKPTTPPSSSTSAKAESGERPSTPDTGNLLGATVELIGGYCKGKRGKIVHVSSGWYTLDKESNVQTAVRARDLKVLKYPGETGPEDKKAEDSKEPQEVGEDEIDDDDDDLTGARIKIKSGKFEGLIGTINELKRFRHVQLDDISKTGGSPVNQTIMEPVKISDIQVLSYDDNKNSVDFRATNDKTGSAEDLGKKYVGARVQVVKTPLIVGTVVKVIVGDWYITDNPKITNAYQAHKFEILEYPDGWKEREERRQRKKKGMCSAEAAKAASVKGPRRNVKSAEKETNTQVEKKQEKKQNDEEKEDTSASRVRAAAAAAAPAADTTDAPPNAEEAPQTENETNQERSLIGATVRIKKGRYRGLVGTIKEKQSIRRIQLDSISTPFAFEDIEVVEYANHGSIDGGGDNNNQLLRNDEFARKYQKYVGATVRVMQPPDLAGTEGKVIRVIVLGDWYITDNPDIPMAFPSHKFDVVKYASEDEEEGGGHEEEEESERRGDDEEVHVIKDEEENEDSDDNRKQPHKENTAVIEKKESIDASNNDDVKKGGDVASVEEKDRKEEEVAPKEKEDVEMKEVGKNDEEEKPKGDSIDNDCDGNDGTNYDPETSPLPAVAEDEKMAEEERDNKKDDAVATSSTSIDSKKGDSLNDDVNENKDEEKQDGDEVKDQTEADASAAVEGKAEATNKDVEQDCNTTKDEGNKLNAESPPSFESNSDPLPGATVYITKGANSGITGKLVMTEERGWWTVEGITGKVSSSKCKLVDDGGVDLNKVREWYKGRNLLERMPGVVKPKKVPGKPDEYEHVVEEGASKDKGRAAKNTDAIVEKGDEGDYKRKVMQTDFTGSDLESKKRKLGVIELDQLQQRPVVLSSILPPQDSNNDKSHPKLRDDAPPEPSLNPILVQASTNDDAENPKPIMQLLPASLRHLPQDTKIEIFNRRTGRIMKGNDAVLLSNLPRALMDHAEYEPIIPPTGRKSRITSRVGRSGPNIRVSHNIVPQTRIRASRVEGRKVLVTGGEYRGLTGKIDSCIPGGWYLVSNLMTNDKLDVVISSRNLELIPQESTNDSTVITDPASPSKKQGVTKVRIHLKAAKLRLDAFIEEKKRLEIHGNLANGSWKGQPQLKRIIAEIAKSKRLIGNLEIALERRKSAAENSTGPQDTAVSSSSSSAAAAAVAVSAANK